MPARSGRYMMKETKAASRRWLWGLFLLVFFLEYALGHYISHIRGFISGDALSRVANAFYVFYSRDPHLAAIGFVWNPLPSLLDLIPLLLWPIFPSVASSGLAGVFNTALFAALSAVFLFWLCLKNGFSISLCLFIFLLYAFNPFIFIYGSNGMSEIIFAFFILLSVGFLTFWIQKQSTGMLVVIGFALGLAFLTRYESVVFGAALAASIPIVLLKNDKPDMKPGLRQKDWHYLIGKTEGSLIIVLVPAIFCGLVWMGLNYSIMGDALYFFRSGYSNLAFAKDLADNTEFTSMMGSPLNAFKYVLHKSVYFIGPLAVIMLLRLCSRKLFRWDMLILLLLTISIPIMQMFMLVKGASYGWLRFFFYPLVIGAGWIPYEIGLYRSSRSYKLVSSLFVGILAFSSITTGWAMTYGNIASEEHGLFQIESSGTFKEGRLAKEIAAYMDHIVEYSNGEAVTLTDSFSAFQIIVNSKYPKNLVITSDRNFQDALRNPQGAGIDYVLVPKPEGTALLAVNEQYPALFDQGADWCELEKDFGGAWRLYKVKH